LLRTSFCVGKERLTVGLLHTAITGYAPTSAQTLSAGEKARLKKDKALLNKAKANPELAAAKKEKNDACRE
jgi:hypothetical protein